MASGIDPLSALAGAVQNMSNAASTPAFDVQSISQYLDNLAKSAGSLETKDIHKLSSLDTILKTQLQAGKLDQASRKQVFDALVKLRQLETATGDKIKIQDNASKNAIDRMKAKVMADPEKAKLFEDIEIKKTSVSNIRDRLLKALQKGNWSSEELNAAIARNATTDGAGQRGLLMALAEQGIPGAETALADIEMAHRSALDQGTKNTMRILQRAAEKSGATIYDPIALEGDVRQAVHTAGGVPSDAVRDRLLRTQTQNPVLIAQMLEAQGTDDALKVKSGLFGSDPELPSAEQVARELLEGSEDGPTPKKYESAEHAAADVKRTMVDNAAKANKAVRRGNMIKGGLGAGLAMLVTHLMTKAGNKNETQDPRILQQLLAQQMLQQKAGLEMDGKQLMNLNRMLSAIQKLKDIQGAQVIPAASPGIM